MAVSRAGTRPGPVADGTPAFGGRPTPVWEWYKAPSSADGGLQALLVASGLGAGAWAMSPCLESLQESQSQRYIHVDFSHYTQFPQAILGQMQFRIDATGTSGFGGWQGVATPAWDVVNHVVPTEANVFPPLVASPGAPPNLWLAFSGTNDAANNPTAATGSGPHVLSAFTLNWDDFGLANGSEIQFRFLVGVNAELPTQSPAPILWEVNNFQIDGAKLCVVPEPGSLALVGCALACGVCFARRRAIRLRPAASLGAKTALTVSPPCGGTACGNGPASCRSGG